LNEADIFQTPTLTRMHMRVLMFKELLLDSSVSNFKRLFPFLVTFYFDELLSNFNKFHQKRAQCGANHEIEMIEVEL